MAKAIKKMGRSYMDKEMREERKEMDKMMKIKTSAKKSRKGKK